MELGFLEEVEDPGVFPSSKVGGKPVWVDLQRLPTASLICQECGKPLVFLLQIHAPSSPLSDEEEEGEESERTLFVFMCKDIKCHAPRDTSCFLVLRCDGRTEEDGIKDGLSKLRVTDISCGSAGGGGMSCDSSQGGVVTSGGMSCDMGGLSCDSEVPNNSDASDNSVSCGNTGDGVSCDTGGVAKQILTTPTLCVVCGFPAPKRCGGCKLPHYCSKVHQVHDWRCGHKEACASLAEGRMKLSDVRYNPSVGVVFPEQDIVTEIEPQVKEVVKKSKEERMEDYLAFVKKRGLDQSGCGFNSDILPEDVAEFEGEEAKVNKVFKSFKKQISIEPGQVLRYQRGGEPLFISEDHTPKGLDIPRCKCGADRKFELQIMPQLLYHLKLDSSSGPSIDWGTLLIYTCSSDSCSLGPGYHREFLWKQEIS